MKKIIRSPFFYVGDKYKLISQLKQYFPKKIDTYVEAFCGGGSSFLNITANNYFLNDIDTYIIKLHIFLGKYVNKEKTLLKRLYKEIDKYNLSCSFNNKFVPNDLKQKYPKTYYSHYNKESYKLLRADFNKNKKNLTLLYLLLIYGFNHFLRFNKLGEFNLPVGNVDFNNNVVNAITNYINFRKNHFAKFYNLDFEKFINSLSLNKNSFLYFDPPYLISGSEYNKLWDTNNEKRLLKLLDELNNNKIKFALSNITKYKGKSNDILLNWAKKYNIIKIKSNYINYHDNTIKSDINEVLIINY